MERTMSLINALIQIGILVVLAKTLFKISDQIKMQNNQLAMQEKLLNAQLLRDRLEMYWKTYEPVSDDEVKEFHILVEDYMDKEKFENIYKGNNESIRRYLSLLCLYEYLAFTYSLEKIKLPDPLGPDWTKHWGRDLLAYKEFLDVHEYHKTYYPEFSKFIDEEIQNQRKS